MSRRRDIATWTPELDALLTEHFPRMPLVSLGFLLGRTLPALKARARSSGCAAIARYPALRARRQVARDTPPRRLAAAANPHCATPPRRHRSRRCAPTCATPAPTSWPTASSACAPRPAPWSSTVSTSTPRRSPCT